MNDIANDIRKETEKIMKERSSQNEKREKLLKSGTIVSYPNEGSYEVNLIPANGVPFAEMTGIPCVVVILVFILDWPSDTELIEREQKGLPAPKNFLDLSDGEYSAKVRMNFKDGYAFKRCSMKKIGENHYQATVDTVHRYPKSKSQGIVRLLPHDITLIDAGQGRAIGRTQMHWLHENNTITGGDITMLVNFANKEARLPMTEIYSYEYEHSSIAELPLVINAKGRMLGVDYAPIEAVFDEKNRVYPE